MFGKTSELCSLTVSRPDWTEPHVPGPVNGTDFRVRERANTTYKHKAVFFSPTQKDTLYLRHHLFNKPD